MASYIFHTWHCKSRLLQINQTQNPNLAQWQSPDNTTKNNDNNHSLCWPPFNMEYNKYRDFAWKIHENSQSADFTFNVNNVWQKSSSQSNQYNVNAILNQKEDTYSRVLRSYSGAIQKYQTRSYGNSQYDTAGWSRSDFLSKETSQNDQTRAAEENFLVSFTWKFWQTEKKNSNWRKRRN